MSRGTRACISQSSLQHNFAKVKEYTDGKKVWSVVKANAYGHGAFTVVDALGESDGFAVSTFAEAVSLRANGVKAPIILLEGVTDPAQLQEVSDLGLVCVVHCFEQITQMKTVKIESSISIWLKVDTGMHRLGFSVGDVEKAKQELQRVPYVIIEGSMTHLACADSLEHQEVTQAQVERFNSVATGEVVSIGNSAAIVSNKQWHGDWVRPGIMLYGASPIDSKSASDLGLKPVMTFQSPVIAIRTIQTGESIGYGHRWQAKRTSVIATLAVGYGDGYPRHAPDGTPVWLNGHKVSLAGRVSMDMIMIDITDVPDVSVGDFAELWGVNLPVDEVAQAVGTIGYELLTRISPRVDLQIIE